MLSAWSAFTPGSCSSFQRHSLPQPSLTLRQPKSVESLQFPSSFRRHSLPEEASSSHSLSMEASNSHSLSEETSSRQAKIIKFLDPVAPIAGQLIPERPDFDQNLIDIKETDFIEAITEENDQDIVTAELVNDLIDEMKNERKGGNSDAVLLDLENPEEFLVDVKINSNLDQIEFEENRKGKLSSEISRRKGSGAQLKFRENNFASLGDFGPAMQGHLVANREDDNPLEMYTQFSERTKFGQEESQIENVARGNTGDDHITCMDKTMEIEETVYDDKVKCRHVFRTRCHETYVTDFEATQEQKCETSYKKNCQITFEKKMSSEIVDICKDSLDKKCSNDTVGEEVCKNYYMTWCETRYKEHTVEQDQPVCEMVNETRCDEKKGWQYWDEKWKNGSFLLLQEPSQSFLVKFLSPPSHVTVSSSVGAASPQAERLGTYKLEEDSYNDLPLYKMVGKEQYIFVDSFGFWSMSSSPSPTEAGVYSRVNSPTPPLPPAAGWRVVDGRGRWVQDDTLTVLRDQYSGEGATYSNKRDIQSLVSEKDYLGREARLFNLEEDGIDNDAENKLDVNDESDKNDAGPVPPNSHARRRFSPSERNQDEDCEIWPVQKCKVEKRIMTKRIPENKCQRKPQKICAPSNCVIVPGERRCRKQPKNFLENVPKELCQIEPNQICKMETVLVPRLEMQPRCNQVPTEVCVTVKTNPRKVKKPIVKQWCYDTNDLKSQSSQKFLREVVDGF